MNIPARLIRAVVQDIPGLRPILSPRQQRTRELILIAAATTFAHLGRRGLSMRALSAGIWISRDRIQTHFLDIDSMLAEILHVHLDGLSRALGNVSHDPKDRRAAYYAFTRGPLFSMKREHALLIYERQHLPEDLLPDIEQIHSAFGIHLCPENPERALQLLDDQSLSLQDIEAALAAPSATAEPEFDPATATDAELAALCQSRNGPDAETPQDGTETFYFDTDIQPPQPAALVAQLAFRRAPDTPKLRALLQQYCEPPLPGLTIEATRAPPEAA